MLGTAVVVVALLYKGPMLRQAAERYQTTTRAESEECSNGRMDREWIDQPIDRPV